MQTTHHNFETPAEAKAFLAGVEWVNDSAIKAHIDPTNPEAVVTVDEDGAPDFANGDRVFWTDPDDGTCSAWGVVVAETRGIDPKTDTITIKTDAGDEIEVLESEVSYEER